MVRWTGSHSFQISTPPELVRPARSFSSSTSVKVDIGSKTVHTGKIAETYVNRSEERYGCRREGAGGGSWLEEGDGWRIEVAEGGRGLEEGDGWRKEMAGELRWLDEGDGWRREIKSNQIKKNFY